MTDALRIAEETLALDAKATEGPWAFEQCGEKCNDIFIGTMQRVDENGDPGPLLSGCPETTNDEGDEIEFYREAVAHIDDSISQGRPVQDAYLIAHYRTSAPALARAVLDYEKKLREADAALIWAAQLAEDCAAMPFEWAPERAVAIEAARARETARDGEGT